MADLEGDEHAVIQPALFLTRAVDAGLSQQLGDALRDRLAAVGGIRQAVRAFGEAVVIEQQGVVLGREDGRDFALPVR